MPSATRWLYSAPNRTLIVSSRLAQTGPPYPHSFATKFLEQAPSLLAKLFKGRVYCRNINLKLLLLSHSSGLQGNATPFCRRHSMQSFRLFGRDQAMRETPRHFRVSLKRRNALSPCFIAFSSRGPVPASLQNARDRRASVRTRSR